MFRIDNATAVGTIPPMGNPGPPGFWTPGDPGTSLPATILDYWWFNMVQEEICTVVTAAGLTLQKTSTRQLYDAITAIAYGANPDLSAYLPLSGGTLANPGNLVVSGNLDCRSDLHVAGGGFFATGRITANLIVEGNGAFNTLNVNQGTNLYGDLTCLNFGASFLSVAVSQDIIVTGNGAFGTANTVGGMNVNGALTTLGLSALTGGAVIGANCQVNMNSYVDGNLQVLGHAYKPGGGTWEDIADARLSKDVTPYDRGLNAVRRLAPVSYRYNGLGGLPDDGRVAYGLVAEDTLPIMPEMVGRHAMKLRIDDAENSEFYTMNCTALTFALVNAVQELADRVEALEAAAARPLPA